MPGYSCFTPFWIFSIAAFNFSALSAAPALRGIQTQKFAGRIRRDELTTVVSDFPLTSRTKSNAYNRS